MKKLHRKRSNGVIAGICSGIGDYFDIDPVLIRLIWVVFAFAAGGGIVAYLIAWAIIPEAEGEG